MSHNPTTGVVFGCLLALEQSIALLLLDHSAHCFIVVAAAGVFAAVGGDNEHGFVRHLLPAGVFMDIADVANGPAHGVQQGCSAAGEIFLLRHGRHLFQRQTVVNDRALVIEKHGGDQRLARFLLLPGDHGFKAADGVRLQSVHGAAA